MLLLAIVVLVIAAIALGPSRQLREDSQLDDEVETRILLRMDPDPGSDDSSDGGDPIDDEQHPKQYARADVEALEHLDGEG